MAVDARDTERAVGALTDALGSTTEASLKAVEQAHSRLHVMFWQSFGVTFFAAAFVLTIAAVLLRLDYVDTFTVTTFLGLIAFAFGLAVMSFVLFLMEKVSASRVQQGALLQNEEIVNALRGVLEANLEAATKPTPGDTKPPPGVVGDTKPPPGLVS